MKNWLFPLWVIIDVLLGLSSLALWIAAPEYMTLNFCISGFALALGILLAMVRMNELKLLLKSSYFKSALHHGLNVFLALSILGVVNYLGNKNFKEFDLTREKRNSLAGQTLKVLEMIKSPLQMQVYGKREEWEPILNVLKLYSAKNKFIKVEAIDTDLRPDLVKTKGITQNGTVILHYEKRESQFIMEDELSVTNALLKILRTENISIYFVKGHQEISCDQRTDEGLSFLCEKLSGQNYEVRSIDLTKTKEVPKDAHALVIAGPITSFLPQEAEQVKQYLERGGSLFLALAPAFKAELYDNIASLAEPYGLALGKDVIIDRESTIQGAEATIPIITKYSPGHPITRGFSERTIFPLSSSVSLVEGNDTSELLALTSAYPGSWAETNLAGVAKGRAEFNADKDHKGPIGLLGVGERSVANSEKDSRFILLGSSSFLVNGYQGQSANTTLFLNAVSWMVNDEGIISLNRPGMVETPVILSSQHLQLIFVISILLVPVIFFGTAIFIYRRRRLL